ncbi:MAG: hypothetical protein WDN75_13305 [Bacteroidota bacterium]
MEGGEILEPVNIGLENHYVVILTPDIHVSTAEAYEGIVPAIPENELRLLIGKPVTEWKNTVLNDFEKSIFQKHPGLLQLKSMLYDQGALYACMSGSGSSIVGIFKNEIDARLLFKDSFGWSGWL